VQYLQNLLNKDQEMSKQYMDIVSNVSTLTTLTLVLLVGVGIGQVAYLNSYFISKNIL
jgi:hypothetical protein